MHEDNTGIDNHTCGTFDIPSRNQATDKSQHYSWMEQAETRRRLEDARAGGEQRFRKLFMMLKHTHGEKKKKALERVRFVAHAIK